MRVQGPAKAVVELPESYGQGETPKARN